MHKLFDRKTLAELCTRKIHPAFAAGVIFAGGLLAALVYGIIDQWEAKAKRAEFHRRAGVYVETVERKLQRQVTSARMVAALFRASESMGRAQFHSYVRPVARKYDDVKAFEWITPADERWDTEQGREDVPEAEKREKGAGSPLGNAVIKYRYPGGADAETEEGLSEALQTVLKDTIRGGEPQGVESSPTFYVQTERSEYCLIVPVNRGEEGPPEATTVSDSSARGWVRMVCDLTSTFEFGPEGSMPPALSVSVFDVTPDGEDEPVYTAGKGQRVDSDMGRQKRRLSQRYGLSIGGHKWSMILEPTAAFNRAASTWQPIIVAGQVLGFAVLASLYLWVVARKERESDQLAHERATVIEKLKETQDQLREALTDLRRTERVLADQERQKALSCVAKGIAHDFNNALSPVRGYADLLMQDEEKLTDVDTVKKYIRKIKEAAEVAADTVSTMSKFYQGENVEEHRPLDVNELAEKSIESTRSSVANESGGAKKDIEWDTDLEKTGAVIYGREEEVCEVLTNILENSVEAIGKEGIIRVRTGSEENRMVIQITDDGVGMGEETLRSCTDPFYTTNGPDKRGLGLSISEGIVARHGGNISINSEPGVGTRVRIEWPTAATGEAGGTGTAPVYLPEGLRFLVIENGQLERALLYDLLRSLGYMVKTVSTAYDGVREHREQEYDVVMVDEELKNLNLEECVEKLNSHESPSHIIVVSGRVFEERERWESTDAVDGILGKPIQLEKLETVISEAISED